MAQAEEKKVEDFGIIAKIVIFISLPIALFVIGRFGVIELAEIVAAKSSSGFIITIIRIVTWLILLLLSFLGYVSYWQLIFAREKSPLFLNIAKSFIGIAALSIAIPLVKIILEDKNYLLPFASLVLVTSSAIYVIFKKDYIFKNPEKPIDKARELKAIKVLKIIWLILAIFIALSILSYTLMFKTLSNLFQ